MSQINNMYLNDTQTLLNCLLASGAINENDPKAELLSTPGHSIEKISVSKSFCDGKEYPLEVKYMVCSCVSRKKLIVSFRATERMNDFLTYIQFDEIDGTKGGFHSSIFRRSEQIPLEYFINKILNDDTEICFTGHGLGASVAALVAIRILFHAEIRNKNEKHKKVFFIGFGAIPFVDHNFKEFIEKESKLKDNFHFYFNENDALIQLLHILLNILYSESHLLLIRFYKAKLLSFMNDIIKVENFKIIEYVPFLLEILKSYIIYYTTKNSKPNYLVFGKLFNTTGKLAESTFFDFDWKNFINEFNVKPFQVQNMKKYLLDFKSLLNVSHPITSLIDESTELEIPNNFIENDSNAINNFSVKFVVNEFNTDIFITISCDNKEFINNAHLQLLDEKIQLCKITTMKQKLICLIFSCSNSLLKNDNGFKIFKYKKNFKSANDEDIKKQFSNDIDEYNFYQELNCSLISHFNTVKEIKFNTNYKKFVQGFSQKQEKIEQMPLDLLYMYAIFYIKVFEKLEDTKFSERCIDLKIILDEIEKIWSLKDTLPNERTKKKKKIILNERLNGFSEFRNLSNDKNDFRDDYVKLTDYINTDFITIVSNELPTCYELMLIQSRTPFNYACLREPSGFKGIKDLANSIYTNSKMAIGEFSSAGGDMLKRTLPLATMTVAPPVAVAYGTAVSASAALSKEAAAIGARSIADEIMKKTASTATNVVADSVKAATSATAASFLRNTTSTLAGLATAAFTMEPVSAIGVTTVVANVLDTFYVQNITEAAKIAADAATKALADEQVATQIAAAAKNTAANASTFAFEMVKAAGSTKTIATAICIGAAVTSAAWTFGVAASASTDVILLDIMSYLNTLKFISRNIEQPLIPYDGCYENIIRNNENYILSNQTDDKTKKILKTILLNRKIRDILCQDFLFGVVGKSNCGKSTFIQKITGANANASPTISTRKMTPYKIKDSLILIDYPHYDSTDISHKLQLDFSKYLLDHIFMVCTAIERMDSVETMELFNLIKNCSGDNVTVILNKTDQIFQDCKSEDDFRIQNAGLVELIDEVKTLRLEASCASNVLITCLTTIDDLQELDKIIKANILTSDKVKNKILSIIDTILPPSAKYQNIHAAFSEEENSKHKKVLIKTEYGRKDKIIITLDAKSCQQEKDYNAISTFSDLVQNFEGKLRNPVFMLESNTEIILKDLEDFFKTNEFIFLVKDGNRS